MTNKLTTWCDRPSSILDVYCCYSIIFEFIGFYHELQRLGLIFGFENIDRCVTALNFRYGNRSDNMRILLLRNTHLRWLDCGGNFWFSKLPTLPNIITLYCNDNNLTQLPSLPNCRELECYHNFIKTLPDLPKCVILDCSINKLTRLPRLRKCKELTCSYNMLRVLPKLPLISKLRCMFNPMGVIKKRHRSIMMSEKIRSELLKRFK
jgi:Leucine-rich repeat (LRR) protein